MGVINAINDGKELDLNANTITLNALGQFLSEVASPFAEESIIFERLLNVTARGGTRQRQGPRSGTKGTIWGKSD